MSNISTRGRLSQSSGSEQDAFEKSSSRVGESFQAQLPPFSGQQASPSIQPDRGVALWYPLHDSFNGQVEKFLRIAITKHKYSEEQALALLTWHEANFDQALANLPNFTPINYEWSAGERRQFFSALNRFNKQFQKVKILFPNRTINELILFYYLNKRNQQTLYELGLEDPKWVNLCRIGFISPGLVVHQQERTEEDEAAADSKKKGKNSKRLDALAQLDALVVGGDEVVGAADNTSTSLYNQIKRYLRARDGLVDRDDARSHSTTNSVNASLALPRKRGRPARVTRSSSLEGHKEEENVRTNVTDSVNGQSIPASDPVSSHYQTVWRRSPFGGRRTGIRQLDHRSNKRRHDQLADSERIELPANFYYIHSQFLTTCRRADEHEAIVGELESTASELQDRIDQMTAIRAQKEVVVKQIVENIRIPNIRKVIQWTSVDIQLLTQAIGEVGFDYDKLAGRLLNKTPDSIASFIELNADQLNLNQLANMAPIVLL